MGNWLFRIAKSLVRGSTSPRAMPNKVGSTLKVEPSALILRLLQSLANASSLDDVLSAFHIYLSLSLPDPYVSLWSAHHTESDNELLLVDEFGNHESSAAPKYNRLLFGKGIIGLVAANVEFKNLDFSKESDLNLLLDSEFIPSEGIISAICHPILRNGSEVAAVIFVGVRDQFDFTLTIRDELDYCASEVLSAISRVLQKRADKALMEIVNMVSARYDNESLTECAPILGQQLEATSIWIFMKDYQGDLQLVSSFPERVISQNFRTNPFCNAMLSMREPLRWFHALDQKGLARIQVDQQIAAGFLGNLSPPVRQYDHIIVSPIPPHSSDNSSVTGFILLSRSSDGAGFLFEESQALSAVAVVLRALFDGEPIDGEPSIPRFESPLEAGETMFNSRNIEDAVAAAISSIYLVFGVESAFVAIQKTGRWSLIPSEAMDRDYSVVGTNEFSSVIEIIQLNSSPLFKENPVDSFGQPESKRSFDWSEILLPLNRAGELLGVLGLHVSTQLATLLKSPNETNLLVAIADQISVVISEFELRARSDSLNNQIQKFGSAMSAAIVAISMGHEVKNSLVVLDSSANALLQLEKRLEMAGLDDRAQRDIGNSIKGIRTGTIDRIRRISNVAKIIGLVSSVNSPGQEISIPLEPLNINKVMQNLQSVLEITSLHDGVTNRFNYDSSLDVPANGPGHLILASEGAIGQIMINLVRNAIDASNAGSRIDISTHFGNTGTTLVASIRIQDYGTGIADEHKPFIYQPFYTTKGGFGVGLVVVRSLVLACSGNIEFVSSGGGTTFTCEFPIIQ